MRHIFLLVLLGLLASCGGAGQPPAPLAIGLIAPLSGELAPSGQAIQRGMLLAMDEINAAGGVLGRPLRLLTRDIHNDPAAGVAALRELVLEQRSVAVFGGIFSPVMLAQLDAIHELQVPLINPWGSVSEITANGRTPNYAFRLSVSDTTADEFLARYTLEVLDGRRPGILADSSAWGDSNVRGLSFWFTQLGVEPAGVERFPQGETNMLEQLTRLRAAEVDSLVLVANAPEGAAIVRGLALLGWRPPTISHWGITGGQFVQRAGIENAEGVLTLQTFSFMGQRSARSEQVLQAYHARFGTRTPADVMAVSGVAHGYDGVHLLARAIMAAQTTAGPAVRDALERLGPYDGLLKRYEQPWTPERHDALGAGDYLMAVWRNGILLPAPRPRLEP